jgi:hypothetical protein
MRTSDQTKAYIKATVADELPQVTLAGVREWITKRLTDPCILRLSENSEGTKLREFWIVTDHKGGKHYRIAYDADEDSFGIVTSLASGVDWYRYHSRFLLPLFTPAPVSIAAQA